MIFQTEKQLKEFGDKLSDDKKAPIQEALTELKTAHEKKDLDAIDSAMEKINTVWTMLLRKCIKQLKKIVILPMMILNRMDHLMMM